MYLSPKSCYEVRRSLTARGRKFIAIGSTFVKDNMFIPTIVFGNDDDDVITPHFSYMTEFLYQSLSIDDRWTLTFDELIDCYLRALSGPPTQSAVMLYIHEYVYCLVSNQIRNGRFISDKVGCVNTLKRILSIHKTVVYEGILDELMQEVATLKYFERKVLIIQKRFREAIANPQYDLCRRRLSHEFQDLCCV